MNCQRWNVSPNDQGSGIQWCGKDLLASERSRRAAIRIKTQSFLVRFPIELMYIEVVQKFCKIKSRNVHESHEKK